MKTIRIQGGLALGAAAIALLAAGVGGQEAPLDATREAVKQRIEIEKTISKEKLDWSVGRELLESRIELTRRQIDGLREDIAESRSGFDELTAKKAELAAEIATLKDASAGFAEMIPELEARTRALVAMLPDPLKERVQPLAQRIPSDPNDPNYKRASLSERGMNVVGILNLVKKFNREVLTTSEVRELPGGKSAEVTALYVGLGQAYFVTANGDAAGVGRPGASGWEWEPANELAPAIAKAIAIYKNEQPAEFVRLPVSVGSAR